MSLVDGFRQGFGMMSDYYNRKDAKEYRQEQLGLQRRRMDMAEDSHNADMLNKGLNTQILQNQVNDLPAANKYRDETRGLSLDNQKAGLDAKRMQTQVAGQNLSNAKALGGYEAEDRKKQKLIERAKAYYAAEDYEGFARDRSFAGTDLELLQDREGVDAITDLNMAIELGDNAGIVSSANRLFKPKLNRNVGQMKGRNGGVIKDITILDFAQQQDGSIKVPVRVTTDSGTYNSYISEMRGIDPNDPDKTFTADELFGKAAVMGNFASRMKASGSMDKVRNGLSNYFAPQNDKGNNVPAEVKSVALLSEMTGYSPKEIVRAKYFSQKDPSGVTLQNMAIELAQKDPRLTKIGAKPDQQAINAIVGEYLNMLSKPVSQDELNATNNQGGRTNTPQPVPTPTPAPDAAIQALRQDPSLADEFKAKYNYLPEGF